MTLEISPYPTDIHGFLQIMRSCTIQQLAWNYSSSRYSMACTTSWPRALYSRHTLVLIQLENRVYTCSMALYRVFRVLCCILYLLLLKLLLTSLNPCCSSVLQYRTVVLLNAAKYSILRVRHLHYIWYTPCNKTSIYGKPNKLCILGTLYMVYIQPNIHYQKCACRYKKITSTTSEYHTYMYKQL